MIENNILYDAIDSGSNIYLEFVETLLKTTSLSEKNNLFIRSVLRNNSYYINLLLNYGADINYFSEDGTTVLYRSVMQSIKTTRLLLDRGADPNIPHDVYGSPLNRIMSKHKKNKIIKLLLKYNADVNLTDSYGYTSLHLAVYHNRSYKVIKLLLDSGANVNAVCHHGTVLHMAVCNKNTRITKMLLDYGADISITNINGLSPLYKAVVSNRKDISKLLLEHGSNVNLACRKGRTALHGAVTWKRKKIVRLLLNYGADINFMDKNMQTPLTCIQLNDNKTAEILVSHIVLLQHTIPDITNNEGFIYNNNMISRYEKLFKIKQMCDEELHKMKSIRLSANITADMLLTSKNTDRFIRYIENPLMRICISGTVIYYKDLMHVIRRIHHRNILINKAMGQISSYLTSTLWVTLPYFIQYSILELLTNKELELITC